MKSLEQELKDVKDTITFVHAEVEDIGKKENEQLKKSEGETKKKN